MDAATAAARLRAEGIDVRCHRSGLCTASLTKPRSESWVLWLRDRIRSLPGAEVALVRERPSADPYFAHAEVRFSLGRRPEFIHSVIAQQLDMEDRNHEVAKAEGAVTSARECVAQGKRPGSDEGPGRVSPGVVVGREQGRAA